MTSNYETPTATLLGEQATVLVALAGLAVSHPNLPGAYFVTSDILPRKLAVQLDSPGKVEAWSAALNVPTDQVVMRKRGEQAQLKFETTAYGVEFCVYAVYDPATQAEGVAGDAVLAP
ncbi:hypothetical protein ACFV5E_30090 [Streptomyces chartreusis]|uniref:hypothetical protein n=1 Tax=Streptomyces chartreusis TaxID=1969 RepID=UPI0036990C1D